MSANGAFPVRVGEMFKEAFAGYFRNIVPLTAAGLVTLATFYVVVALPARAIDPPTSLVDYVVEMLVLILALTVVGAVAYPWYSYALDAARAGGVRLGRPFQEMELFMTQAVASLWFWAGVGLGLRYLFGIPAIFVGLLYCFHGFFIADRKTDSGLKALGLSVRLTEGRRVALLGLGTLLGMLTLLGALPLGIPDEAGEPIVSPLTVSLSVVGLAITTSITLVAGAVLYLKLQEQTPISVEARTPRKPPQRSPRRKPNSKSKGKTRGKAK